MCCDLVVTFDLVSARMFAATDYYVVSPNCAISTDNYISLLNRPIHFTAPLQ